MPAATGVTIGGGTYGIAAAAGTGVGTATVPGPWTGPPAAPEECAAAGDDFFLELPLRTMIDCNDGKTNY